MGIDTANLAESQTLSAAHPSEAPRLDGGSYVSGWFSMDSERAGLSPHGVYVDSPGRPYMDEGYGAGVIAGYRFAASQHLLWAAVDGWSTAHGVMPVVAQ